MDLPLRQKPRRTSLGEIFDMPPDTTEESSSLSPVSSPKRREKMAEKLRSSIRAKWPPMAPRNNLVSMTIHADSVYRTYSQDQDPEALFQRATSYLDAFKGSERTQQQQEVLIKEIHELMIHAIFGSNRIENAGLGLDITLQLCRKILRGEPIDNIDERTTEYESKLMELSHIEPSLKDKPLQYILRGRREIVQHVKALQHLIHHFVVEEEDMTEELLKETHGILCKGVSIIDEEHPEVQSKEYAGIYRQVHVGAGNTMFTPPKFVPKQMGEMCEDLKKDLSEAMEKGAVDPFSLATKYSLKFVQIHPFQDGNGRMCRMILNVIVFRFTGVFIPIGEREGDRKEYMDIKKRASRDMEGHGEYATFVLTKASKSLQKLKKKLHGKKGNRVE